MKSTSKKTARVDRRSPNAAAIRARTTRWLGTDKVRCARATARGSRRRRSAREGHSPYESEDFPSADNLRSEFVSSVLASNPDEGLPDSSSPSRRPSLANVSAPHRTRGDRFDRMSGLPPARIVAGRYRLSRRGRSSCTVRQPSLSRIEIAEPPPIAYGQECSQP